MNDEIPTPGTDEEWRQRLTKHQYRVLRKEGTESPWSSALNGEKRRGQFVCAGCGQPLFSSAIVSGSAGRFGPIGRGT